MRLSTDKLLSLSENIQKVVSETLESYGIVVESSQLVFITDNGANIIAALEGEAHIRCVCHCLNLTISQAIKSVPSLKTTLDACSELVTHFKRCGLQCMLTTTLKKDVETRWNSIVEMLRSIVANKDKVVEVLTQRNEEHWIGSIDFTLLEEICDVLMPFKLASEELSADKLPTLHLVLPFIKMFKVSIFPCPTSAVDLSCEKSRGFPTKQSRESLPKIQFHL